VSISFDWRREQLSLPRMKPNGNRSASDGMPSRQRSAISNGKRLFVEGDGTSAWSRRYRDLIAAHVSDLGGTTELSEAQQSLVKRAAALETELEQLEGKLSLGESIDLDAYGRATNTLRRTLEALGLRRIAVDITDSATRARRERLFLAELEAPQ
jgi:hypothetical protein